MPRSDLKRTDVPVCLEHQGTGCRIRFAKCRVAVDQSASVEAMPCAQHGDRCKLNRSTCQHRGHDCGCRLLDSDRIWAIMVVEEGIRDRYELVYRPIDYVELERRVAREVEEDRAKYDRIHSAPGVPNDRHFKRLVEPGTVIDIDPALDELIKDARVKGRERDRATVPSEFLAELAEHNPAALVAIQAEDRNPVQVIEDLKTEALASDKPLMPLIHKLARRYFLTHSERHPEIKIRVDAEKLIRQIRHQQPDVILALEWEAERLDVELTELVEANPTRDDQAQILFRWRRRDRGDESAPTRSRRPKPSPILNGSATTDVERPRPRSRVDTRPRTIFT
jgi:hypothetical protein